MRRKKLITAPDEHLIQRADGTWERRPGRLAFSLSLKSLGPAESAAIDLLRTNQRLLGVKREALERRLACWIQAYGDLSEYLTSPLGDIPIQSDSAEVRNLWHTYLLTGRELIDELGSVIHICFGLSQGLRGLNAQKFTSLRTMISQVSGRVSGLAPLTECLDDYEDLLVDFIDLRNRDKTKGDTVQEFPWISERGVATGGVVGIPGTIRTFDFVAFFEKSHSGLLDFAKRILAPHPTEVGSP